MKRLLAHIQQRGHQVGFHPGYDTVDNRELFRIQLERLQAAAPQPITGGRQHYLRFRVPDTWQMWAEMGLEYDSTMAYSDFPGFRCGTCYEFTPFNVLTRQVMNIKEYPLIAMDTDFRNHSPQTALERLLQLKETCKQYQGNFVFLWHNSNMNTPAWKEYREVYEKVF